MPFCDLAVADLAWSLPASVKVPLRPKGFMRDALRSVLPAEILRHPKQGFQVPLARWLRTDLAGMLDDLLSDDAVRRRGYVRPEYVRWLRARHAAREANMADQLYALLVLELWHRQLESRAA